jgi:acetyl esterase
MTFADDLRIDPRIRTFLGDAIPPRPTDAASRDEILAHEYSPTGEANYVAMVASRNAGDYQSVAPSTGLSIQVEEFVSQPDGNRIKVQFIRPEGDETLPCVYYIHGGGMVVFSCFDGQFSAWGRMIAAQGVAVAMVDFRNALRPSSAPEIAPYPAGLNDCISGLRWLHANAGRLNVDPSQIVIAGDSGGGNLALATAMKLKREGDIGLVKGLYVLCPYIAGEWPRPEYPSSTTNNGILADLHSNRQAMTYGIEAYNARDPLAWPSFATAEDVRGLPPTVIHVNECDPLLDEGIAFFRLLLANGVKTRCQQLMGTIHSTDSFLYCPEISRSTASNIAHFTRATDV